MTTSFSDLSLNLSAWWRKRRFAKSLPIFIQILAPKKNDIILDVGAGTGVIADEIARSCDEVFALEPDPKRVEFMKKRFPQVKSFDGEAEAIPFPELYFTKIYAISSLHHFRDKDAALYEFNRVLKRDGSLVIKDSEPQTRTSKFESRAVNVHFMTSNELKEKLEQAGFQVKELRKLSGGNYFISSSKL